MRTRRKFSFRTLGLATALLIASTSPAFGATMTKEIVAMPKLSVRSLASFGGHITLPGNRRLEAALEAYYVKRSAKKGGIIKGFDFKIGRAKWNKAIGWQVQLRRTRYVDGFEKTRLYEIRIAYGKR